jgi:hypothetical protein
VITALSLGGGQDDGAVGHGHAAGPTVFRDIGDTYNQADTLDSIGQPYVALGHSEQARTGWLEALTLYQAQHRTAGMRGAGLGTKHHRSRPPGCRG